MHTIIRDNYDPTPNEYHETIVVDEARGKRWLFDCDGVFHDITNVKVVSERGDSEEYAASQKWLTEELEALEAADQALQDNIDAEETARIAADETLQDNIDAEEEARTAADTEIWDEIEALEAASDVVDIVGTKAELDDYDTSKLSDNDIIKVLADETHDDAIAYYRWDTATDTFTFVGVEGPYYTASETDTLLAGKQDKLIAGSNIQIAADGKTISATDTTYAQFTGATASADGVQGLVPAPLAGGQNKVLKGDGTWGDVSEYTLPPATTNTLGGIIVGNNLTVDANGTLDAADTTYTAGTNVQISAGNVISATDTTYSAFTGATSSVAGAAGLVPAPTAGDEGKFLQGDGTWATVQVGSTDTTFYFNSSASTIHVYKDQAMTQMANGGDVEAAFNTGRVLVVDLYGNGDESGVIVSLDTENGYKLQFFMSGLGAYDQRSLLFTDATDTSPSYDFYQFQERLTAGSNIQISGDTISATDTTYSAFGGATSSVAGSAGLVPAPTTSDPDKFLKGDGTWANLPAANNINSTDWNALWQ